MHGLILRSVQLFVSDVFGAATWARVADEARLDHEDFEAMLSYDDALGRRVLDALPQVLDRTRPEIMEDFGTYLVSHPNMESLRRLLRFGGSTFSDFMHSLDDLPDRARLAVSNLTLPGIELREHVSGNFSLTVRDGLDGMGHILIGLLRAVADDYGALVVVEHCGRSGSQETLAITLLESTFAKGRDFDLAAQPT